MTTQKTRTKPQALASLIALTAIGALTIFIANQISANKAWLFLIGVALGITLLHAMFGFTGGWRNFIRQRNSAGIRAQIFLIALTSIIFFPLLGKLFPSISVAGALAPVNVSVFVGAFLFGIGMQLGGGCGSGTLFTVGQGQTDMLLTLLFFIVGATIGTAHLHWWSTSFPGTSSISLIKIMGWIPALLSQLLVLFLLYRLVRWLDHYRNPSPSKHTTGDHPRLITRLWQGPWPLIWAVILLALLNLLTLLVAGHPWSITFAFGLWGAKIYSALGGDPASWSFWTSSFASNALHQTVLADTTSVMNFGIILGAVLAASLAGKYAPEARYSWTRILTAIIGGLLLGYGARLAYGCNIGALLGGIASGSLHGWLWLVAAFAGAIAGVKLRIWIRLDPPVSNGKI